MTRSAKSWLAVALLLTLVGCGSSETPGGSGPPAAGGSGGSRGGTTGGSGGRGGASGGSGGTGGAAGSSGSAGGVDAGNPSQDSGPSPADAGQPGGPDAAGSPDARSDGSDAAADGGSDTKPADGGPPGTLYNPCPPKGRPCVALPLGDSLTQGAGSSGGGYRRELFREVVASGQSITFVGSGASGPAQLAGVPFPRNHEGHGGFTIQNLAAWVTEHNTVATYKPDIVLLSIGTNNGLRHPGPNIPAVLQALGALIDQLVAADPRMLVIVAQIAPSRSDDGVKNTAAFNAGIPAVVAARVAAGKHVMVADIHRFFVANPDWKTAYLPGSDVHPNDAGYDAMGRGWYNALGPLLR